MKSKVILILGVLLMLSGFILSSCIALPSNDVAKFVGTWNNIEDEDSSFVFRADGTGTFETGEYIYAFASGKIVLFIDSDIVGWEYYFTPDGKTLFLYSPYDSSMSLILKKSS
jgi:hypothetical protein